MDSTTKVVLGDSNTVFDFTKVLQGHRFILEVVNKNELRLMRLEQNDHVMSLDDADKHILSAINPKQDSLKRIMIAVQERLSELN